MGKLATTLLALTLLGSACSGESNVKVTAFTFFECKQPEEGGELATGRESADYAGLECVAWRFSDASTAIDLVNRAEGCGFDGNEPDESLWTPKLVQGASDALTFSVSWEFEGASACGSCLHDFSIAAQRVEHEDSKLALELKTRSCSGPECVWTHESIEIPKKQFSEGIRCRYVEWNRVRPQEFVGKLGGPARDGVCDDELVAVQVESGATLCLKACTEDADCHKSLSACKDGACQLTDPW